MDDTKREDQTQEIETKIWDIKNIIKMHKHWNVFQDGNNRCTKICGLEMGLRLEQT